MIDWDKAFSASTRDKWLIGQIAKRAVEAFGGDEQDYAMDVEVCHCLACPLDLEMLLNAPDPVFGHDVNGIGRHLCRKDGVLTGHFLPRCAVVPGGTK